MDGERAPRLEWEEDFLPGRDRDLEDEARELAMLVRVAKSSGLTRERVSIPLGPCVVVRRGEGYSSTNADVVSLDLRRVLRLYISCEDAWRVGTLLVMFHRRRVGLDLRWFVVQG